MKKVMGKKSSDLWGNRYNYTKVKKVKYGMSSKQKDKIFEDRYGSMYRMK